MEEIVKLSPVYKDYIWGGTKLRDDYWKNCSYERVAESWELSANKDGQCILNQGMDSEMPFDEYVKQIGEKGLGRKCRDLKFFPLMIKLIDAKSNLSIQVHPRDEYALKVENSFGKNEMWYILDCEPEAFLYIGFNKDVTKEEVERRVLDHTLTEILNKVYVKKGQSFFIEAGTVHAIGAGTLICEIQQNSNITYRLYDYGRLDKEGKPRALHLKKALDVLDLKKKTIGIDKKQEEIETSCLMTSKYFSVNYYQVKGKQDIIVNKDSFIALVFLEGDGKVSTKDKSFDFKKGDTFFICAGDREAVIEGNGEFLTVKM